MNAVRMTGREMVEHARESGDVGYIGMWVGCTQIAAAVRQSDDFERYHGGYGWHLWSSFLDINNVSPLAVRDERDARAWLVFIADLYEGKLKK